MRSVAAATVIGALVLDAAHAENDLGFLAARRIGVVVGVIDRLGLFGLRFLRERSVVHAGMVAGDPRSVNSRAGDHYVAGHTVPYLQIPCQPAPAGILFAQSFFSCPHHTSRNLRAYHDEHRLSRAKDVIPAH